jgi:hypothetical protein
MIAFRTMLLAAALPAAGCASVASSMPGATNYTGEAWYTETKTFFGLPLSARVYYCPAPTAGPAACMEAQMVEDYQPPASPGTEKKGKAPAQRPAEEPYPGEESTTY